MITHDAWSREVVVQVERETHGTLEQMWETADQKEWDVQDLSAWP